VQRCVVQVSRVAGTPLVERLVLDELWVDVTDRVRVIMTQSAANGNQAPPTWPAHLIAGYVPDDFGGKHARARAVIAQSGANGD
jgi:hypothetical protein